MRTSSKSVKEVLIIVKKKYTERDPMEEAIKAFKLFDEDNTGKISLRNLKKIAR
jgi:centrin-3